VSELKENVWMLIKYAYIRIKNRRMKDILLKEKIDSLPENLKEQVSDYVDFLLYRYVDNQPELNAEEKTELDERWKASQQGTLPTSDIGDVKERLEKKYGVSN
jgi:hypothetical protein